MQRSSTCSEAKQQRAGRVLVVGVVFDDLGGNARFLNLGRADVALDHPPERVPTKLKLACGQLPPNLLQSSHASSLSASRPMRYLMS